MTFAGVAGVTGTTDGTGAGALFNHPGGVAVDSSNNVYVADQNNNMVRRITPDRVVTTIGGAFGFPGFSDGTNSISRFTRPSGLVIDNSSGVVYVADLNNNAIRKITPRGTNWATTTIAGNRGGFSGSADGTNFSALFNHPHDLALDNAGNLYVADTLNKVIRKMTPDGTNWIVTTIAGQVGVQGTADGTNGASQFFDGETLAVDNSGRVFVGDGGSVRMLTPSGTNWIVTTIVGVTGTFGMVDGTNDTARMGSARGLDIDGAGNLYAADLSQLVRKITPVGTNWVVTTLAGLFNVSGSVDGAGLNARFLNPCSVAVDAFGNLYVADFSSSLIRKGFPFAITNPPAMQGVPVGTNVTLAVSLFGAGPFSYQWCFNGLAISGETNVTLSLASVQRTNSGSYSVTVMGPDTNDVVTSSNAVLRVLVPPMMFSPQLVSGTAVRLQFQDGDGGVPFDLNSIEVQWRTNLPSASDTNWQSLTTGFFLTNGMVEIDDTNTLNLPQSFYRVVEH